MKNEKGFALIELMVVGVIIAILAAILVPFIMQYGTDASVASRNLSTAADQFEIDRRIVFVNGITGDYLLSVEGRCSITDQGNQLEVVCRTSQKEYKKHFLGLSDNVTYFAEQLDPVDVSIFRYRVIFKPSVIVPNVDFK